MHNNMPEQKQLRALLAVQNGKARSALRGYLRARGDVVELRPGKDISETIRSQKPEVILLEIEAGGTLMSSLRDEVCEIPIIAVAPPVADLAFEAAKLGAAALLTLPLDEREIESRLSPVLQSLSSNGSEAAGVAGRRARDDPLTRHRRWFGLAEWLACAGDPGERMNDLGSCMGDPSGSIDDGDGPDGIGIAEQWQGR